MTIEKKMKIERDKVNLRIYKSETEPISRYICEDNSGIIIKENNSAGNFMNKKTGVVASSAVESSKFDLYLALSEGCTERCTYCYTTLASGVYYHPPYPQSIFNNVCNVIDKEIERNPGICNKYANCTFLCNYNTSLRQSYYVRQLMTSLCGYIVNAGIVGINGVDIKICLSKNTSTGWPYLLTKLDEDLQGFPRNFATIENRSLVRILYSIGAVQSDLRQTIMPNTKTEWLDHEFEYLKHIKNWYGVDVIFQHLLFDGVNDSMQEAENLVTLLSGTNIELEFLRYNTFEGSPYIESTNFDTFVEYCANNLSQAVRYQVTNDVSNEQIYFKDSSMKLDIFPNELAAYITAVGGFDLALNSIPPSFFYC